MKKALLVLLALIVSLCAACSYVGGDGGGPSVDGNLRVTFIDVGQGDSALVISPSGKTMLIDCGEETAEDAVQQALCQNGVTKIDVLVGTHPHSDHIGSMSYLVDDYEIGKVYLPQASSNTKTYERLLTSIQEKGLKVSVAKAGVEIPFDEQVSAVFVGPCGSEYGDLNDASAVLRLEFGGTSFLFTGDAEASAEEDILAQYGDDLQSDVLKAGHHGSRTSSSQEFLEAVQPQYVIISCGEGNDYGHPHAEALQRFEQIGAQVYRTDLLGSIEIISDGATLSVNGEAGSTVAPSSAPSVSAASSASPVATDAVVYRTKSGKAYHVQGCPHIADSDVSAITVQEAQAQGLTPCKTCIEE